MDQYNYQMNERNPNDTLSYIDLLKDQDLEHPTLSENIQEEFLNTVNTFVDNTKSFGQMFH